MNRSQNLLVLLARLCLGAVFAVAGIDLAGGWSVAALHLEARGVPVVEELVLPLGVLTLFVGSVSVVFGVRARAGASLLIGVLVPAALVLEPRWSDLSSGDSRRLLDAIGLLGGLLLVVAFGAGRWSLDARRAIRKAKHG